MCKPAKSIMELYTARIEGLAFIHQKLNDQLASVNFAKKLQWQVVGSGSGLNSQSMCCK